MPGTYIALKVERQNARDIYTKVESSGISKLIPSNSYHATLLYSEHTEVEIKHDVKRVHKATVKGYKLLGEGRWAAVVLILEAPSLVRRFNAIQKVYGNIHSYPTLTPHVSLKYGPDNTDLDKIKQLIPKGTEILLTGEYSEELNNS